MYTYSPRPATDYRLKGLDSDEISVILGGSHSQALWNLFWLSLPEIDHVPDAGRNWYKFYHPVDGALAAMIRDVHNDEPLCRKLVMHPDIFIDWFDREDVSMFECYGVLSGDHWKGNVLARAELAARRLTAASPPVTIKDNVVTVDFRRSA